MHGKPLFPGQQENEVICLVIHQHWIVLAMRLFIWFWFLILYLVLDYLNIAYLQERLIPELLPVVEVAQIGYLMFLALGFFIITTLYYLNIHIVTSERIVDIDQPALLKHTVSELHLNQMQDVTAEIHGLLENVFNYGDVYIQTAGETERFVFSQIPNPTKVTKLLLDLYEQLPEQQKHGPIHTGQHQPSHPSSPTHPHA